MWASSRPTEVKALYASIDPGTWKVRRPIGCFICSEDLLVSVMTCLLYELGLKQDMKALLVKQTHIGPTYKCRKHGLKMNLDKTEVMWVRKHREELNIRLEGKDIKQVNNVVYLGGNISENGRVEVEVRRRIQAGANAWRNVEGVMMDRKISRKLKRKVLDSCVVPASTYGLETLALSELHQHKLQVCENNWIRRIAGVRRVERRRMKDLREEVGTKACIVGKIVKSRMKWAGHMVRMKDEKLPKRSEKMKHDGCRKRGLPQLRWEDCAMRDLRKAEEEEKWREKANNRDRWKRITKVAVHRSDE